MPTTNSSALGTRTLNTLSCSVEALAGWCEFPAHLIAKAEANFYIVDAAREAELWNAISLEALLQNQPLSQEQFVGGRKR